MPLSFIISILGEQGKRRIFWLVYFGITFLLLCVIGILKLRIGQIGWVPYIAFIHVASFVSRTNRFSSNIKIFICLVCICWVVSVETGTERRDRYHATIENGFQPDAIRLGGYVVFANKVDHFLEQQGASVVFQILYIRLSRD